MRMKSKSVFIRLFLVLFLTSFLSAQQTEFPQLIQDDVSGGKITKTEFYVGEELWGLINGGADLYLEYGLDRTLLQEVVYKEKSFRIEIYGMTDIDAAFGIFSINKFNCEKIDTLVRPLCITPYQLQAAVGRFYISISNQLGDKDAQNYSLRLFESLLDKTEIENYTTPEYFQKPQFEQYQNQIKLIKGKLGLQNGFPRWEKYFNEFSNYEIVLLPIKVEGEFVNLAKVVFYSENDAERFLSINKNFSRVTLISQKEFVLLESNLAKDNLDKIIN